MKKLIVLVVVLIGFLNSCNKSEINYELKNIFSNYEWQKSKVDTSFFIQKKILTNIIYNSPTTQKDSIEFKLGYFSKNEISLLPKSDSLKYILEKCISESKYLCKNTATFKPYKINISFIHKELPRNPTKEDSLQVKERNKHSLPDESYLNTYYLKELYYEDKLRYDKYLKEDFNKILKGSSAKLYFNIDFLASNAFGVPSENYKIYVYDLEKQLLEN